MISWQEFGMKNANLNITFTPTFDCITWKYDNITSLVYGRVWRYSQGDSHVCRASQRAIAESIGTSVGTINNKIKILIQDGFLVDLTPDLIKKPHRILVIQDQLIMLAEEYKLFTTRTDEYAICSSSEQSVHGVNTSVHLVQSKIQEDTSEDTLSINNIENEKYSPPRITHKRKKKSTDYTDGGKWIENENGDMIPVEKDERKLIPSSEFLGKKKVSEPIPEYSA